MDNEGTHAVLTSPEPKDKPGTRPVTNWPRILDQVRRIQGKLAGERAELARKLAGEQAELARKKGNKV